MKTNYEIRYAAHPEDAKHYDTARLRRDFLVEKVFAADEVNMVYSMYDRMIVGGAMPVHETLRLEAIDPLKAPYFLTRRELGIFNVGGPGVVTSGDKAFDLQESTYWSTVGGSGLPHLLVIDMGKEQTVSALEYLPCTTQGDVNGVKDYKIYVY